MEIVIRKYEHFNKSLPNWDSPKGKYISSKKQYNDELKKNNMIPFEEAQRMIKDKEKKWTPSKDCIDMIKTVYETKNKKNEIVLGRFPKIVDALKKKGMTFKIPKWITGQTQGGFNATD